MSHDFRGTAYVDIEVSEIENIVIFMNNVGKQIRKFNDEINIALQGTIYQHAADKQGAIYHKS